MFENYSDIFSQRGQDYHLAMTTYPLARNEEFNCALNYFDFNQVSELLDAPSGPGYLKSYLHNKSKSCKYIGVDPSSEFSKYSADIKSCEELSQIDLPDQSIQACLSLAGLHHESDRKGFYKEVHRILINEGSFVIGEVVPDSSEDYFLNTFVHNHSSMGHLGDFLSPNQECQLLEEMGFRRISFKEEPYVWRFNHSSEAAEFFKLLFGIDKLEDKKIIDGIESILGVHIEQGKYLVNWKLGFYSSKK